MENISVGYWTFVVSVMCFLYGVSVFGGSNLSPNAKQNISQWLLGKRKENWATEFCLLFDGVFGEKHRSARCFLLSSFFSMVAVILLYSLIDGLELFSQRIKIPDHIEMYNLILWGIVLNFIPDYISLYETRLLLKYFSETESFFRELIVLLVDAVVSALIISVYILILYNVFKDAFVASFGDQSLSVTKMLFIFSIFSVFFYSTFITSFWAWIFCISTWIMRISSGTKFCSVAAIKEKPVQQIGIISAFIFLFISFFYWPVHHYNKSSSVTVFDRFACATDRARCQDVYLTIELLRDKLPFIKEAHGEEVMRRVEQALDVSTPETGLSLDLSGLELKKVPVFVSGIDNLKKLYLDKNRLVVLPSDIGDKGDLVELSLNQNELEKLPDSISGLKKLEVLALKDNKLKVLPESISDMDSLKSLDASGNVISILPEKISSMKDIEELVLSDNAISFLPENLSDMENLKVLLVNRNNIDRLPVSISGMKKLETIGVSGNAVKNIQSIGKLNKLKKIDLVDVRLTEIPDWLRNLDGVRSLNLSMNNIKVIPAWVSDIGGLEVLNLSGNDLQEVPSTFLRLNNVKELHLSNNYLGKIPDVVFSMDSLEVLDLSSNRIKKVPQGIGRLVNLKSIDLSLNNIQTLPNSISMLKHLEYINMSINQLSEFPENISKLERLKEINLNINGIDTLPISIFEMENLRTIRLRGNGLSIDQGYKDRLLEQNVKLIYE